MRFRPHSGFCMRCKKSGSGCDLDFEKMKPMKHQGAYSYAVTLVICKDFKQRER